MTTIKKQFAFSQSQLEFMNQLELNCKISTIVGVVIKAITLTNSILEIKEEHGELLILNVLRTSFFDEVAKHSFYSLQEKDKKRVSINLPESSMKTMKKIKDATTIQTEQAAINYCISLLEVFYKQQELGNDLGYLDKHGCLIGFIDLALAKDQLKPNVSVNRTNLTISRTTQAKIDSIAQYFGIQTDKAVIVEAIDVLFTLTQLRQNQGQIFVISPDGFCKKINL
ncbi:MAG: hypothetical protein ACRCXZ_07145 [Patescibacteria group bacterium]